VIAIISLSCFLPSGNSADVGLTPDSGRERPALSILSRYDQQLKAMNRSAGSAHLQNAPARIENYNENICKAFPAV
jgi:hypothetical protein